MSWPQVYLLGAALMALRTLWSTRPQKCSCCEEMVSSTTANIEGKAYDLRYLLVASFAAIWPFLLAIMLFVKLYFLMYPKPKGPDDDDLRPA